MSERSADHVTPYDRCAWSADEVEAALARGSHAAELRAYFGAAEHRTLAALARRAARTPVRDARLRVVLVPGIMGSQLGLPRPPPLPPDILWIDPLDFQRGRLAALRLEEPTRVVALGVVLFSYLRLQLQLRAHGFAVECHDYDWRRSLTQLGAELATRLRACAPTRVALVGHSMGGLLARAALTQGGLAHVERVVLLGTPNSGSFAAVQALRGTYAVVRKLARLVPGRSAEALTQEVFSSFTSLYELLPRPPLVTGDELFDLRAWPAPGPRPRAALLTAAHAGAARLANADERFTCIAGTGEETVTALSRARDGFVYTLTRHGDGTVPTLSAVLPGARTAYTRVAHSELTRDPQVAAAVADVLRTGGTRRLPAQLHSASRARARVSDSALRRTHTGKVDWVALSPEERRTFLENLNEPPHLKLRVPRAPRRRRARR